MKKFLFATLTVLTAISVFAEPYSKQKYKSFKGVAVDERKYCFEAQISKETDFFHMFQSLYYLISDQNKSLTVQEIKQHGEKFASVLSKQTRFDIMGQVAGDLGHEQFALNCYQISKSRYIFGRLYNYYSKNNNLQKIEKLLNDKRISKEVKFEIYFGQKDYAKMWKTGQQLLLVTGGYQNVNYCNKVIVRMFKYRDKSVTKEQQIAFLEQIAQIYPIPGTDFNKWKNFMGFVGFKYKQLTKKQLF